MPTVEEQVSVSINQSAGSPPTCFALPGKNLDASWSNVNGSITLKAMDNAHLYMDISISITDNVISNEYPVIFGCRNADWEWSYGASGINIPGGFVTISTSNVIVPGTPGVNRGDFNWNISRSNVDLGPLSSWGANIQGDDGVMWISGTGTYEVTDQIYPDPYRLVVPGFIKLFDYYPFAVRKGGAWMSCNRSGGGSFIRKSGSWRDLKNSRMNDDGSNALYRSGSSWPRTPLIGSGSE